MKLVRFGAPGQERPGMLDHTGQVRDLSGIVPDISGPHLSAATIARLRGLDPLSLPQAPEGVRLGPPVGAVRNFVAVGLNYADHAAETGATAPAEPILFHKAPSCIVGPHDSIVLPKSSAKTDWEVELGIVIGERASYVAANEALDYVAGYCVCNDVSEREFQLERGGTWSKGKGCPTFGPLGPWLVTPDEVADVQHLGLWLDVNGTRMQTGSTASMIFNCAKLVSYISHFMILEPGDVIATGTPPGVALGRKPERYLRHGDVVTLGVEGLGEQRLNVVAYDEWTARVAAGEATNPFHAER